MHIETKVVQFVKSEKHILPKSGVRKMKHLIDEKLMESGLKVGRDKLFKILKDNNLLVKKRKRKIPGNYKKHAFETNPNKIKNLSIDRPEKVWVADITYIKVKDKWHYLSLVTDAYSKRIMGYAFSDNMTTQQTSIIALKRAMKKRRFSGQIIHHSDRGFQYCSPQFLKKLKNYNLIRSNTEKKDPYENAIAERVNGILKYEFDLRYTFSCEKLAENEIKKAINIYNSYRPHLSLNMNTPNQVHFKHYANAS